MCHRGMRDSGRSKSMIGFSFVVLLCRECEFPEETGQPCFCIPSLSFDELVWFSPPPPRSLHHPEPTTHPPPLLRLFEIRDDALVHGKSTCSSALLPCVRQWTVSIQSGWTDRQSLGRLTAVGCVVLRSSSDSSASVTLQAANQDNVSQSRLGS